MREIAALEAENTLGALLDLVQQGEEVVITRDGKPVARLVRERTKADIERGRRAMNEIRELSRGLSLGGIPIKSLIEEGRK